MKDHEIIELYWARNESAITATTEKYGNYCHTGQHRTRLRDDDKNLLVRSVHKAPSHVGRPVRRRDVWVIRGSFRRLSRQKGASILSITAMDVKAVLCQGCLEKWRHTDFVTVL